MTSYKPISDATLEGIIMEAEFAATSDTPEIKLYAPDILAALLELRDAREQSLSKLAPEPKEPLLAIPPPTSDEAVTKIVIPSHDNTLTDAVLEQLASVAGRKSEPPPKT